MKTFESFLAENLMGLNNRLNSLGVDHYLTSKEGTINISKIVVPKEKRNEGIGSKAMKEITSHADKHGMKVTLTPTSDFGGNKSRLVKFYKRHGFVENKGKNKDFSTRESMIRHPSPKSTM